MNARLAVLSLCLISPPAIAEEPVPEARAHFLAGDRAYKLGEFSRAIEEFEKSYDLFPAPVLLYDLAQSNRKLGNNERALVLYRRYLTEVPTGRFSQIAQQIVLELERAAANTTSSVPLPPSPPPLAAPSPAPVVSLAAMSVPAQIGARSKPVYKRWWLWTTLGVVVVGGVVGVAVGVTLTRSGFQPNGPPLGPGAPSKGNP